MENIIRLNTNVLESTFKKITELQTALSTSPRRNKAKGEIVDEAVQLYYELSMDTVQK